jgi:single-strand DNA-binding protein
MSQDNQITLRGYVTAEPKFRQTVATATPVAEIRVGCTPRRLNRETGEWQDAPTSYYTVKCWRRLAVNASSSLRKGDMVVIRGRFYVNEWIDSQQRPRSVLEIEADSVGHDLAYGWSRFLRGTQPRPGEQAALNAGEAARQDLGPAGDADDAFPGGDWDEGAAGPDEDGDTERHQAGDELTAVALPGDIGGLEPEAVPA